MNINVVINEYDRIAVAEVVFRKLRQGKIPRKQVSNVIQETTSENEIHDLGWTSSTLLHNKGF